MTGSEAREGAIEGVSTVEPSVAALGQVGGDGPGRHVPVELAAGADSLLLVDGAGAVVCLGLLVVESRGHREREGERREGRTSGGMQGVMRGPQMSCQPRSAATASGDDDFAEPALFSGPASVVRLGSGLTVSESAA